MKQFSLFCVFFISLNLQARGQCPASGTPVAYAWVNPAGTYLDLGSKRPMEGTHHKIFDLRTGKFVTTGTNKYDFPLRGYGFVYETETRFQISDFTNWSHSTTNISVMKDRQFIINKAFTKYAHIFYDTVHGRGLIQEPNEGSSYKLHYLAEGAEPVLLDKSFRGGNMHPCRFSPDGKYAVGIDGTVVDMEQRKVLTTKMGRKQIYYGPPVFSPDSRTVAFHGKRRNTTRDRYMMIYDLASQDLLRELHMPDSLNSMWEIDMLPLPDMERAVIVLKRTNNHAYEPGTAYLMSANSLTPLCFPGWKREKDEYEGKTTNVYDEVATNTGSPCNMEVAAMEVEGKYDFSIAERKGVLYLSARPSGDVSGSYTYTRGTTKMKGKILGKLTSTSNGGRCVHTFNGTYDESLFGGDTGSLTLIINNDGKSLSGAWKPKKN